MKYARRRRGVRRVRRTKRKTVTGAKRKAPRKWYKRKSYKKQKRSVSRNVTEGVSWTRSYIKSGRKKGGYSMVKSLAWTGCESITLRKRGVKNFNDSGLVPMFKGKFTLGGETYYPLYAICLNDQSFGFPNAYPVRTLGQYNNGGGFFWLGKQTQANDGSGITYSDLEKGKLSPATRLIWRNTQIKLNLWGSKNRPIRFTVQVVSMKDPRHSPFNRQYLSPAAQLSAESQQVWEETLKQYTFNPISRIDWHNGNDMKVYKSFDITIQPTESIDHDTSPKVHSLTWNTTWDKTLKFERLMTTGTDIENNPVSAFNEVGEVNENLDTRCPYPDDKSVVFLLIRATDYGDPVELSGGFDNAVHGSFDYDIRTTHLIPGII